MRLSRYLLLLLAWLFHAGLYLLFTVNVGWRELIAAGVTAIPAAAGYVAIARATPTHFHLRLRDVAAGWRMPWYALEGSWEIMQGIARQLFNPDGAPSFIGGVTYRFGDPQDPVDAGRRALAVTYTTATPNFVVLGLVEQQQLMIYHQIIPGKILKITKNLGAIP